MDHINIALGVFVAMLAVVITARRIDIPYPIALVIGGLALSLIPGLSHITLEPDLIFLIVLPPLLYTAAYFTSIKEFREQISSISFLAIGLVVITTIAVAILAHYVFGLQWAGSFILGAIVSPPDAIAATSIAHRLGLKRNIVTILEGESLVNDATALVIYRLALAAALTGVFSLAEASLEFVIVSVGGIAVGLITGWIAAKILERLTDPTICIASSIVMPYISYLPADSIGMSGVLSVVTAGLYIGWYLPKVISPTVRLEAAAFWKVVIFGLNGLVFILIGLQLPNILADLKERSLWHLIYYGALVSFVVIVVRLLWVYIETYLPRFLFPSFKKQKATSWKHTAIIGWCGMRGVVSLAAALALPVYLSPGEPFIGRDLIIFLTFCVIFSTLVIQGLTLPVLIKKLEISNLQHEILEEAEARVEAAKLALTRLNELSEQEWVSSKSVERMKMIYEERIRYANRLQGKESQNEEESKAITFRRLQKDILNSERRALLQMHYQGKLSNEVMRRILHDIDLEASHLRE